MQFQHINPDHTFRDYPGTPAQRLARYGMPTRINGTTFTGSVGPYRFRADADGETVSFYLDSDFAPGLRWEWADEIADLGHTGWFSDPYGDFETIRGLVMRLPGGRGFLAGWSMGEGMCGGVDRYVFDDETDAAYAADSMAEHIAELNRENYGEE